MKKEIRFVETVLRDGNQSLAATRMSTAKMVPILAALDEAGYEALEVWGGATFDACLRYLDEDPWERLRTIRKAIKKTKLQMLLRGQNLLGYKHYPDDVVDAFIERSIANGIDIVRVFDALNDPNNLMTSIKAIKKYRGHAQVCLCYTTSPVHTIAYFVDLAKQFAKMGADSIAIKDMAGILTPAAVRELVPKLKKAVRLPIEVHTHATSGVGAMTYLLAAEAGVQAIDTAISPFAGGTSQPATESMAVTLKEMGYDIGLNFTKLAEISEYFKGVRDEFLTEGIINPKVLDIVPETLIYQVPGGMLSNLLAQLKEAKQEDKYEAVLKEVPKVRADLGYPPLVTPLSQMVGTQAVMNILSGERYKLVPNEIKEYLRGYYGKAPGPVNEKIRHKIIGKDKVLMTRPADELEPMMDIFTAELGKTAKSVEDVLMYALFPTLALPFLKKRENPFYDVPIQHVTVTL